jgi:hypothetical protein
VSRTRRRFDLHAGLMVPPGHRDRVERLCRYALRPPLAQERRRHMTREGEIWLARGIAGQMAPPTCASIRWSCWSGWPC